MDMYIQPTTQQCIIQNMQKDTCEKSIRKIPPYYIVLYFYWLGVHAQTNGFVVKNLTGDFLLINKNNIYYF